MPEIALEELFNEDPWAEITQPIYPDASQFYVMDQRVWASKDEENRLVFFIQIPMQVAPETIETLKGAKIQIVNLQINEGSVSRLLITLEDDALKDQFTLMTKALVYYISKEENSKIFDAAKRELKEWSDFLKPDKKGLTKEEQIGLWGELYVLTQIMLAIYPLTDAIKYWIRPDQKKQDFTFNNMALETKTTMSGDGSFIKISSIEQLQKITDVLYLCQIFINSGDDEGISLQEFFDNLEESLNNDIENKIQFTKKVSKFRNKATEKNLTEKFHFIDLKIFNVGEGFPKITRKEITSTAVQNIKYSIDSALLNEFYVGNDLSELISNE